LTARPRSWHGPARVFAQLSRRSASVAAAARGSLFYRRFIPRGGLCFDIGANAGDRTELFLTFGAQVVTSEPQAGCAKGLRRCFGDRSEVVEAANRA